MGDKPRAELFSALAHLYRTRDYSDLVLFAKDGARHPVHRCIICPRSKHFANIVREGRWRERNEGHIAINDEEPEVVRLLVEYLYLLDYDPNPAAPATAASASTPTTMPPTEDSNSSHGDFSDTMSVRTEAGQYGHVYGTSAVSAFGGPSSPPVPSVPLPPHHHHHHLNLHSQHQQHQHQNHRMHPSLPSPPLSTLFRHRTESAALTVHALPTSAVSASDFAAGGAKGCGGSTGGGVGGGAGPTTALPRRRQTARGIMVTSGPEVSPLAAAEPGLLLHARLYAAAGRFGIEGLRALALDKFKIQLTRHWDSTEFPEAIHIVYQSTPAMDKDMRETVADTLEWHSRLLDKPEIEVAIMEINGLAYELLKRSRRAEPEYMD